MVVISYFHRKALGQMSERVSEERTVERSLCASNLIEPVLRILCLPDTKEPIKCRMMEVEDGITRTGERVILQATNGKVTGSVQKWLGQGAIDLPSVGTFFEAVNIWAAEEVLHILYADLLAPEEVDVAGQTARVVFECLVDGPRGAEGGDSGF